MPWDSKDASRHTKKARSAKAKRAWSEVANRTLRESGDEGKAVRIANYVAKRVGRKSRRSKRK